MFKLYVRFFLLFSISLLFTDCNAYLKRNKRFWGFGGFGGFGGTENSYQSARISDCPTTDGNRTGICVRSASECVNRGGRAIGNCYATPQSGSNTQSGMITANTWQTQGIAVGICCFYQVTCGGTIISNGTYFRNPNAPAPYTDSRACSVTIQRTRSDVCQLRLDFLIFDLARPRDGTCETDRFVVNGQSQNSIIPPLCGYNTGQHMYIDLNPTSGGPVTLNVLSMGNRNRVFDIRVLQIHCSSTYRAPTNCLQHHIGVQGSIRSFNYEEFNTAATGYFNNLDYSICFRKEPGFCTVTYSVPSLIIDINQPSQPQEPQSLTPPGRYFNIITDTSGATVPVSNDQAGAGPYDCPNDYLLLAGTRLCGYRLNSQLYPPTPNPSANAEVTDNSTGPIYARFVTNYQEVGRGFYLNYRMNPCFIGG